MYQFELKPSQKTNWTTSQQWEKEIEKFFDVFSRGNNFAPACEIYDEDKSYCISLDIPGLSKEDLDIEVKDNHLHITGERKYEGRPNKDNILRTERRYGKFERIFSLPKNVNSEAIEARFENGVLDIILPKEEKSQAKKITISDWKKDAVSADLN
jgi:HSP20 family protein